VRDIGNEIAPRLLNALQLSCVMQDGDKGLKIGLILRAIAAKGNVPQQNDSKTDTNR
jgi:hypothetical protein